ncbi:MAG: FxLYD domain-containing protein [Ktedonobacteraceae bacterium]
MIHQNVVQKYSSFFHRFAFTQRAEHHLFARATRAGLAPALVKVLVYAMLCMFVLLLTSCNWPGTQQTAQSDPRLKLFHVLSARIIMLDSQAEVDGTLQNTSHSDHFPYDVTVIATFYNSTGTVVGQAGGVAEDVYPGMTRPFTLIGQVDNTQYSHMVVTVISLKERRIEKNIPTPTVAP